MYLGKTIGNIPVGIDLASQNNPHLCILGITGSGKSVTCKTLATRYHDRYQSKILVIDYAGEYAPWVLSRGGIVIDMSKNSINPFELGGEPLLVKIQQVVEAFEVICNFNLLQTNIFDKYVEKAYELSGFRLHDESTWRNNAPNLAEIIQLMENDVQSLSAPEQATVESVLRRLRPLAQGPFGIFKASPISLPDLTKGFVCLDLSKLASNSLKDLIAWTVFQYIDSVMRIGGQHEGIELLIIIEAHRICRDARAIPVRIIKEGRKYGYAVIVVAQDLSDLAPQIIANVGTMIIHQITHPQYVRFLERQLGLAQHEVERLRNLERGEALVKLSTDPKPFFVRVEMEKVEKFEVEEEKAEKEIPYAKIAEKKPEIKSLGKIRAYSPSDNLLILSADAGRLLEAVRGEEGLITTEYYKRLGLNSYMGNKAKAELERLGLIEARELPRIAGKGRFGKILKLTEKARSMYNIDETKRFGGELHKHIVRLLSSKLSEAGLSVEVEATLGSGRLADIVVNKKVAFEIETRGFREENVVKSLNAGMEKVVVVCQTEKTAERIKEEISEKRFASSIIVVSLSSFLKNMDAYLHELGLKEVGGIELRTRNR
ncbi:MAG: ATP-binding protein [Candidatus Brockarchaeota archaeon]|nr:ATP-binding protein [Candidatus Brockarchaeota archaeon]